MQVEARPFSTVHDNADAQRKAPLKARELVNMPALDMLAVSLVPEGRSHSGIAGLQENAASPDTAV